MKLLASLQALDREATERFGIPELLLMETAARQVAKRVLERAEKRPGCRIVLLAGPGNNGGDAFACARQLWCDGHKRLHVLYTRAPKPDHVSVAANFQMMQALGIPHTLLTPDRDTALLLDPANIIVDGLFGSGLDRPITGVEADVIHACNRLKQDNPGLHIISIDMPSGIHSRTGQVMGCLTSPQTISQAIQADETVTFAFGKPGLYLYPGKRHAGRITVQAIGLPPQVMASAPPDAELLTLDTAAACLPQRPADGHKYQFGHVLVVAGCRQFAGAACLTASAALKAGAGLVTLAAPLSVFHQTLLPPEIIQHPLPETVDGSLSEASWPALETALIRQRHTAVVIGPGLSLNPDTQAFMQAALTYLRNRFTGPVVLDADALNALASLMDVKPAEPADNVPNKPTDHETNPPADHSPKPAMSLLPLGERFCLTPHTGEAQRLMPHLPTDDPVSAVEALRNHLGATVVLKTAVNLIGGYPVGRPALISPFGNSGMATAGSGDVLAGLIAGFAAQQPNRLHQAVTVAVALHGLSGDKAAEDRTPWCLTASTLLDMLPEALHKTTDKVSNLR